MILLKYFAYKKEIETNGNKKEVYVIRPSFLTLIVGEVFGDDNYFSRQSFETRKELEEYIEGETGYFVDHKIIRNRLSFFTPASSVGFYEGKFERINRTPVGKLEEFSKTIAADKERQRLHKRMDEYPMPREPSAE